MVSVLDLTGETDSKFTDDVEVIPMDSVRLLHDRIYRDLDQQSPNEISARVRGLAALARALNVTFAVINPPTIIRSLLEEALVQEGVIPLYPEYAFCMDGHLVLIGYLLANQIPDPFSSHTFELEYTNWRDAYSSRLTEQQLKNIHQKAGDLWPIYLRSQLRCLTKSDPV